MRIEIENVAHDQQRYNSVGDWFYKADGTLVIRVSNLSDWRREALIAVHELVEVILCKYAGITQEMVDRFDMEFEKHRHPDNESEPGDDPCAPYRKQHCFATGIERCLAAELEVNWAEYENELGELP